MTESNGRLEYMQSKLVRRLLRENSPAPGCLADERLQMRWNLTLTEKDHLTQCQSCESNHRAWYRNTTYEGKKELIRLALGNIQNLTNEDIKEIFRALCFYREINEFGALKGYYHDKECPCRLFYKTVAKKITADVIKAVKEYFSFN